jgi:hypothetical protein
MSIISSILTHALFLFFFFLFFFFFFFLLLLLLLLSCVVFPVHVSVCGYRLLVGVCNAYVFLM